MKRADVPLEQFEIQFNPQVLDDIKRSREVLVTILRFLDINIFPYIEEFRGSIPQQNEIENHQMRTAEDGRFLLFIESQVRDFVEDQTSHVENYLNIALQKLSQQDKEYVMALVMHKVDRALESVRTVAHVASKKFDGFVKASQGHMTFADESSEIEEAITKAGENYRTSVDRLLKS